MDERVTVMIPTEYHRRLKATAALQGKTLQQALTEAVVLYLAQSADVPRVVREAPEEYKTGRG